MMLRILRSSVPSSRQRHQLLLHRAYAAAAAKKSKSKAKRALTQQQVAGSKSTGAPAPAAAAATTATSTPASGAAATPKKPDAPPTTTASKSSSPPPAGGAGGGGGGFPVLPVVGIALLGGAGAYAYYNNMIPGFNEETPEAVPANLESETKPAPVEAAATTETTKEDEPKPEEPLPTVATTEEQATSKGEADEAPVAESPSGNRVVQIAPIPPGTRSATIAEVAHPVDGHRVSMDVASKESPKSALDELKAAVQLDSSRTLQEAHTSLRTQAFDMWLTDLEDLTPEALRIRIVQLVSELQERTKWEAVRLKEFLIMREKETGDKYLELMQKERLELETKLATELRVQEDALTRKYTAALQEKDAQVEALVKAATDAAVEDHAADLASVKSRLEAEIGAAAQVEYSQTLAEHKAEFAKELESKVATIQELAQKLKQLEAALTASRSYESGSLKAHKMSAAALALAESLEKGGSGVAEELDALASAAQDNTVVTSAIASLPARVKEIGGVPTVAELQTRFATVVEKARQASFVPEGREGLDGQLLGMIFSAINSAPNANDPAPEDEKDSAKYVLARASQHVKLGELERAVGELVKLSGQAAFTIQDWKEAAQDRIATDKALQAIKMECALLNESFAEIQK